MLNIEICFLRGVGDEMLEDSGGWWREKIAADGCNIRDYLS